MNGYLNVRRSFCAALSSKKFTLTCQPIISNVTSIQKLPFTLNDVFSMDKFISLIKKGGEIKRSKKMMIQGTAVISAYRSKIKSKYLFPPEILRLWGIFSPKPKDPVTKEPQTDAIYSIPYNDCDNEHIGQTKSQFGTRLKEHQNAVFF